MFGGRAVKGTSFIFVLPKLSATFTSVLNKNEVKIYSESQFKNNISTLTLVSD